jgi:predicted Zn-dependent protease
VDRREFIKGLGVLAASLYVPPALGSEQQYHLVPLGDVDSRVLSWVRTSIEDNYCGQVIPWGVTEIPPEAYDEKKKRYSAMKIWDNLNRIPLSGIIVGVTDVDIVQHDGEDKDREIGIVAGALDRAVLLSTHKLRGRQNYEHRIKVVTGHEIWHLRDKEHCDTPTCMMVDIKKKIARLDTVIYGYFCTKTLEKTPVL